jgi:hypothetical protein
MPVMNAVLLLDNAVHTVVPTQDMLYTRQIISTEVYSYIGSISDHINGNAHLRVGKSQTSLSLS